MFVILITMIAIVNCLEPKDDGKIDDEIKNIIGKYMNKIPDVEPQYVIHEGLSKVISRYFKEKISTFPLYKISLKLDRNPVKIPWTLADPNSLRDPAVIAKELTAKKRDDIKMRTYQYVPAEKKQKADKDNEEKNENRGNDEKKDIESNRENDEKKENGENRENEEKKDNENKKEYKDKKEKHEKKENERKKKNEDKKDNDKKEKE